MNLSKLFESVIREADKVSPNVRIQVEDGNGLFYPLSIDENWREISDGRYIFTGTLDDFANEVFSNGDIEESRREIIKLAKSTPVGELFCLYGKLTDSIACWMLDPNGTETADKYYKR